MKNELILLTIFSWIYFAVFGAYAFYLSRWLGLMIVLNIIVISSLVGLYLVKKEREK